MLSLAGHHKLVVTLAYHYDDLVDYLRRRYGNRNFAQDVVHDVCLELIESPPAVLIQTPLAFLKRAITNRAIDRCRSEDVRSRYINSVPETPDIHVHYEDGLHALDFKQKLESLKRIIETLPPRQRQVFLLHRIHEMSQDEIANQLSISRNMVTQHFTKALSVISATWLVHKE